MTISPVPLLRVLHGGLGQQQAGQLELWCRLDPSIPCTCGREGNS